MTMTKRMIPKRAAALLCMLSLLLAMVFLTPGNAYAQTDPPEAMKAGDWIAYDSSHPPVQAGTGVNMVAGANYQPALDPDYIAFDLHIDKAPDTGEFPVDAWLAIGFMKSSAGTVTANPSEVSDGLVLLLRNVGGKLSFIGFVYPSGDVVGAINYTMQYVGAPGSVTVKLIKQSNGSFGLYIDGYKFGINITADAFTNAEGKTYLATNAGGTHSNPETHSWGFGPVANVKPSDPLASMQASDWNGYNFDHPPMKSVDGGVNMVAGANYQPALDPDYIAFDLHIDKAPDTGEFPVDAWLAIGFMKSSAGTVTANPSEVSDGLVLLLRNVGGKLSFIGFVYPSGDVVGAMYYTMQYADVPGSVTIKLIKQSNGSFGLYIDGYKFGINISEDAFTNAEGKTYLATNAGGTHSNPETHSWGFGPVANVKPSDPLASMQASDWNGYNSDHPPMKSADGSVDMVAGANYQPALDPDYIDFNLDISKMANNNVRDTWVCIMFSKNNSQKAHMASSLGPAEGIGLVLRNYDGKLNVHIAKFPNPYEPANVLVGSITLSSINMPGTVRIRLVKQSDGGYILRVGNNNLLLPGVTKADFTDAEGKTYLATNGGGANDAPDGNERLWSIGRIANAAPSGDEDDPLKSMQASDWRGYEPAHPPSQNETDGVDMCYGGTYMPPLDPGYISFDLRINALTDRADEDVWICVAFVNNNTGAMFPLGAQTSGICFMVRNSAGKFDIQVAVLSDMYNLIMPVVLQDIDLPGATKVKLVRQSNGSYVLSIGSNSWPLPYVTQADFTDAGGKTYLACNAYGGDSNVTIARNWGFGSITNVNPDSGSGYNSAPDPDIRYEPDDINDPDVESSPGTGDNLPKYTAVLTGLSFCLLLAVTKIRKRKQSHMAN